MNSGLDSKKYAEIILDALRDRRWHSAWELAEILRPHIEPEVAFRFARRRQGRGCNPVPVGEEITAGLRLITGRILANHRSWQLERRAKEEYRIKERIC